MPNESPLLEGAHVWQAWCEGCTNPNCDDPASERRLFQALKIQNFGGTTDDAGINSLTCKIPF